MLAVVCVVGLISTLAISDLSKASHKAKRIDCVSNQKQILFAFKEWSSAHSNIFPFMFSTNLSGSKEYIGAGVSYLHFLSISNEIGNSRVLICPADDRKSVSNWNQLSNAHLSYFLNIDASEMNPQSILLGDRNLTNLQPAGKGLWQLSTNPPTQWTDEMHRGCGSVALADGSVQQANSNGLFRQIQADTNTLRRIELP